MITGYGVRGILLSMLAATPMSNLLTKLAYRYSSDLPAGKSEDLSFLGNIGVISEWKEKRNVVQPKEYAFALRNLKFSGGVRIPLDWLHGDKTGGIKERLADLPRRREQFWGKKIATLINNGSTSTATLDGVSFFNDAHVKYSAFDNQLTFAAATGVAPTPLEAAQAIYASYIAMLGFNDDQGEPANEGMTNMLITCGTDIGSSVAQAITQGTLDTGSGTMDNPLKGLRAAGINLDIMVSPRITTTAKMQTWNTSPGTKPLLIQENPIEEALRLKDENSEFCIDNDAIELLLKMVGEAGYGQPWTAAQTEFT